MATDTTANHAPGQLDHSTSRPRLTPGDVLPARREMVRERLREGSLSENRSSVRLLFRIHNGEQTFDEADLRIDSSSVRSATRQTRTIDINSLRQRLQNIQESFKKTPGLTSEELGRLSVEVFSSFESGVEEEISQVSWDCSICLESFKEGDKLICLPCEHRFHFTCLDPWVRTCGNCPCCRRDIVTKH